MKVAGSKVLILGGTSDIGQSVASAYATAGWQVILAAREHAAAERNARDLALRHKVQVDVITFDVCAISEHSAFLDRLGTLPDTIVSVVGMLGDQMRAQADSVHAIEILRTNFEGPALLLGEAANRMAARQAGTIVGVSSVAGDRGRASNYVYGSAKAGFSAFLSGLRNRLANANVRVVTVKPGFVRTRMTDGLSLPKALTAEPQEVGRAIYLAAEVKARDVIYVRPIWSLIMWVICGLPEFLFKRLRL